MRASSTTDVTFTPYVRFACPMTYETLRCVQSQRFDKPVRFIGMLLPAITIKSHTRSNNVSAVPLPLMGFLSLVGLLLRASALLRDACTGYAVQLHVAPKRTLHTGNHADTRSMKSTAGADNQGEAVCLLQSFQQVSAPVLQSMP